MIFSTSAAFIRQVGVLPCEKCKFEGNLFSVHKILISEKSKWSSPSFTRIFKIYTKFHIIWCITLNQILKINLVASKHASFIQATLHQILYLFFGRG